MWLRGPTDIMSWGKLTNSRKTRLLLTQRLRDQFTIPRMALFQKVVEVKVGARPMFSSQVIALAGRKAL